ncbi:MAG TPA: class I SAM-dependent methyltransferase [Gemmataceae bacterium]|jgi:ubiquinone/menaquinone biosynthesis C-methylase UbiE|nr:class I SAM-dependent methyltransferase [Gemmataceae bacterium]
MTNVATQKQKAIEVHSDQADLFADRYTGLGQRMEYRDCFNYSRYHLDQLLTRYLPRAGIGVRLLDVGCGTGHHLAELRARGYEVAGIDGSTEMLEHARTLNPGTDIRQADVDALPFPDNSFDFVLCVEVFRYLPKPSAAIREMARVLKPGGVCLVTASPLLSMNGYALVNRLARVIPAWRLTQLRQFFTTTLHVRREFRMAGFDRVKVHGVYFGPVNWVERLCPPMLPSFLRMWKPIDRAIADRPVVREFSNMFLVHAVKPL